MERKYYNDIDYKPFLFYVVFGVSEENMQVSKSKHHVDEVPAGIDIRCLDRKDNNDYIENFFQGLSGNILFDYGKSFSFGIFFHEIDFRSVWNVVLHEKSVDRSIVETKNLFYI